MSAPAWGLSLAYWLHMLSTVIWVGGLAAMVLLVLPAAQKALSVEALAQFLEALQRRLDPVGWFCLLLLVGTGLFQMSANPNYNGFLSIDTTWAFAILSKHLVFLAMIGVSAYLTWGVLPGMRRAALRLSKGVESPDATHLQRQSTWLLRINLFLAVIVLALTALARVS